MDAVGRSMKWNTVKMGKKFESFLAVNFERDNPVLMRVEINKSVQKIALLITKLPQKR
jgi:hypothetical protein